jgi:hypothetical protein
MVTSMALVCITQVLITEGDKDTDTHKGWPCEDPGRRHRLQPMESTSGGARLVTPQPQTSVSRTLDNECLLVKPGL